MTASPTSRVVRIPIRLEIQPVATIASPITAM